MATGQDVKNASTRTAYSNEDIKTASTRVKTTTGGRFDNLYYQVKKPVRVGLPAGFIGINQGIDLVERKTSRDILASLIDPISPITFSQRIKSLPQMDETTELLLHLDEGQGTTVYDASGNGLTGTLSGTAWKVGMNKWFRKCLSFNAIADTVTITDDPALDFGAAESFSVSFWAYLRRGGAGSSAFVKKFDGGATIGYRIWFNNSNGKITFQLNDGTFSPSVSTTNELSDTEWHYIVCIRNTSTDRIYIYIDGVLASGLVEDTTTGTLENIGDFIINGGSNTNTIEIDDVEIRRGVITAQEIADNWINRTIGTFGGGDVICWDVDADQRVFHWDHDFATHVDILNGMIKYRINQDDGYVYFYGYETGEWITIGKFHFLWYLKEEGIQIDSANNSSWEYKIRELGPDKIIIRMYYDFDDYGIAGMVDLTLRKGCRHLLFDFSMNSDRIDVCEVRLDSSQTYRFLFAAHPGVDIDSSFLDAEFESTANILTANLDDNFILFFEEGGTDDLIVGAFCTDDPTLLFDNDNIAPFGQIASSTEFTDIKVFTTRKQCGFIVVPWDVSTMFSEGTITGGSSEVADGSASNGFAIECDASGEGSDFYVTTTGLEPGAYLAFVRARNTAEGNAKLQAWNNSDAYQMNFKIFATTSAYKVYGIIFIVDEDDVGDTIWIRAHWISGTQRFDYLGCIPISNSKNFIGDIAHQALQKISLTRSGEMD